jgi:lipid-A-disaccharide synthase
MAATRGRKIFLIAGETSGDNLGAKLMAALKAAAPDVEMVGVGGEAMQKQGLASLFPMTDIAVMGFLPVLKRLPLLLRRIQETAAACIASKPDVLVIIDSPDFTHRVARQVRRLSPTIPIVDYVSPTVWAWRPGRAKKMRAIIDHVMAVLPFEPAAHRRLGGPPCTYVGHPLVERLDELRPCALEERVRQVERRVLILPGSRMSEVTRLLPAFGGAVERLAAAFPDATFHLPVVPHVAAIVRAEIEKWPVKPKLIEGEKAKFEAFRNARAALAASGTVTLELGLAQVPQVTAYKVSRVEQKIIAALVQVSTPVLPSLILGHEVTPVFLQDAATSENLASAMVALINDGPERDRQLADCDALDKAMHVEGNNPSAAAAEIVLAYASGKK